MLVLSRKKNQSIVIDGGIEIQILQLKGGSVKLGITAPDHVRIVRGELDLFGDMISMEDQVAASGGASQSESNADSTRSLANHQILPMCDMPFNGPLAAK